MTVAELIEELRKHPGDMRLYVAGYEGGVDDVDEVQPIQVHRNVNTEGWSGDHEAHPGWYCTKEYIRRNDCAPVESGLKLA